MSVNEQGTPCWIDLTTSDTADAARFYGEVFGWVAEPAGDPEQTGGYQNFRKDGKLVGGLMTTMSPQQPTAWLPYISVDNADATIAAVNDSGGTSMFPPMDVMDIGRMGAFLDPDRAALGIWQAKSFGGFEATNVPGSFCWADVMTRDAERAAAFYGGLFGWGQQNPGFGHDYTVWTLGEQQVGGMMQMNDDLFPPEAPSHWAVSFAVSDTDALVERVPAAGGEVVSAAMDCPIGRFATFADPQGARFGVMQFA